MIIFSHCRLIWASFVQKLDISWAGSQKRKEKKRKESIFFHFQLDGYYWCRGKNALLSLVVKMDLWSFRGPPPQPLCDSAKKRTDAQMNRHCLCYLFQNYLLVLHQVEVVGYDGGVGQLMRGQELPVWPMQVLGHYQNLQNAMAIGWLYTRLPQALVLSININ